MNNHLSSILRNQGVVRVVVDLGHLWVALHSHAQFLNKFILVAKKSHNIYNFTQTLAKGKTNRLLQPALELLYTHVGFLVLPPNQHIAVVSLRTWTDGKRRNASNKGCLSSSELTGCSNIHHILRASQSSRSMTTLATIMLASCTDLYSCFPNGR